MVVIGAHVSASGGIDNAISNALAIGADAVQIFGSSPRQWAVRSLSPEEIERFRGASQRAKTGPTFFHAPYLINLGSPDEKLREKSEKMLLENYRNATNLGIAGVIFHIGSRKDLPWEIARKYVSESLKRILDTISGKTFLAIENSAGGGNTIGSTLEEIRVIISSVDDPRLVFCYDTAHGFESGMVKEYTPESVQDLFVSIEENIGKNRLVAIHLNDSKTPYKSNSDRHENIGEGHIGLSGIRAFVQNKNFQKIPWYLEVPGFDSAGPDKKNIDIVRGLVNEGSE